MLKRVFLSMFPKWLFWIQLSNRTTSCCHEFYEERFYANVILTEILAGMFKVLKFFAGNQSKIYTYIEFEQYRVSMPNSDP